MERANNDSDAWTREADSRFFNQFPGDAEAVGFGADLTRAIVTGTNAHQPLAICVTAEFFQCAMRTLCRIVNDMVQYPVCEEPVAGPIKGRIEVPYATNCAHRVVRFAYSMETVPNALDPSWADPLTVTQLFNEFLVNDGVVSGRAVSRKRNKCVKDCD